MRLFKPNVGKMLANRDVDGLIKTLADPETKVSGAALDALIQIGEPAVAALCVAVHDDQKDVRIMAAWALGDIGEKASGEARRQAEEALLAALRDQNSTARQNAATGLGQIRDMRAVQALTEALKDQAMPVRRNAAMALGQLRNEENAGGLAANLNSSDPATRSAAYEAFFGLLALMSDGEEKAREAARKAVEGFGQLRDLRAIQALTEALKDQAMPVRRNAAWALGQLCNEEIAGGLAANPDSSDPEARSAAYQAFFGLLALMGDGEEQVREAASKAVEGFGPAAITPLTNALADEREEVARSAASILSEEGEAAIPALSATLQDGNPRERCLATRALGEIGVKAKKNKPLHAGIVDMLMRTLQDGEAQVRQQAARSLGALGDSRAIPALGALDNDTDAGVRKAAFNAKKAMGWRPPPPPLAVLAAKFKEVAEREGMRYVTSKHSRGELTDPAELQRASIGSAQKALRESYGLSDSEIRAVMDFVARGPQASSEDQMMLDTLGRLCAAYAANDTAAIARLEPEASHIGELLDQRGGLPEMRRIFGLLGDRWGARTLEMHWSGIGEWRG